MSDFGQIPNPGRAPDGNLRPPQPPGGQAPPVAASQGIHLHIGANRSEQNPQFTHAPPSQVPPQQFSSSPPPVTRPPQQQAEKTEEEQPWKTLPRDQCAYRSDGKCIGSDECLRKCDSWAQLRATTKFQFSERYGAPKSPKEAHVFFLARKLSQMEGEDDKKLDLWVQKCRECAFHKTLDNWDDPQLHENGDGQTGWSTLI